MTHNIETVDTRPENILEVRDLKKYFLINKEWKLKKAAGPAPALPETGDAELGPQGGIAADVTEETADRAAETAEISAAPKAKRKLELEKTYVKAVDGVSFDVPYGKNAGRGRRVGLRQEHDGSHHTAPALTLPRVKSFSKEGTSRP